MDILKKNEMHEINFNSHEKKRKEFNKKIFKIYRSISLNEHID